MASAQARKALERAKALHRQGSLAEAERLYQSVLQRDGAQVDALHGLGLLLARSGRLEDARQCVDRALGLRPERAEFHFHRAEIVGALGLREQALESYAQALALKPDYCDALVNMGDLLLQLERAAEALHQLDRALELRPEDAAALNNRGNALQALKRHDEALQCFDRVLRLLPGHADVLNNRANALLSLGRFAEAEAAGRSALAGNARHFHALINLAKAQIAQGALAEGLAGYEAALALHQDDADAWCDHGAILTELRRLDDALASSDRALALDAERWSVWNERGKTLVLMGRMQDALRCYERALSLRPGSAIAAGNCAEALRALGRVREARDAFDATLRADATFPYAPGKLAALSMQLSDWRDVAAASRRIVEGVRAGARVAEPLDLLVMTDGAQDQLLCARTYAGDKYPRSAGPARQDAAPRHDRIRVAYLSADFRDHPTSHLLAGLLERHDRSRFETFGLYFGPQERSEMAARMAAAFEHFVDVNSMSDGEIVEWLRRNEVDIAVDLMGYTRFGRPAVFAARPCPVQVNYLGYPSTTGSDCIDYIIADAFVVPPGGERHYAERVARLPDTYQANEPIGPGTAETPSRAQLGLPERGVVFCSFNNNIKVTPEMFRAWMRILSSVGDSVLWLWSGSEAVKDNLRREAAAAGVDAARLVFAPSIPYPEHLARLQQADLALDTLPFNGGATTSDALRAGVPVVTCPGEAFAARMSGSLLHAIGMPELITPSLDEYQALAIRLATDANLLAATKRKLAANRGTHPLFDTDRFRRHLEAAYEIMHARSQNGEPPAHFSVDPSASSARSTTR
jgi:predicted O-linked N-acetylglucosamine transferase (SPINDLY family)